MDVLNKVIDTLSLAPSAAASTVSSAATTVTAAVSSALGTSTASSTTDAASDPADKGPKPDPANDPHPLNPPEEGKPLNLWEEGAAREAEVKESDRLLKGELKKEREVPDWEKAKGYALSDLQETKSGIKARLTQIGESLDAYGKDIRELELVVEYQTEQRLHVHISDASKTQFQVTEQTFPRPPTSSSSTSSELEFHHTPSPFEFWITRRTSPSSIIFDTRSHPLIFSDQYLQLSTSLSPSANIYGPGEIVSGYGFKRSTKDDRTTLWNRDAGNPVDENIYGTHPFFLSSSTESSSIGGPSKQGLKSFGVFLLNSHAMELITKDQVFTYNLLGGTLDFYFLSGPTPLDVVKQYSEIVGRPTRMPYWAFGLHMCRWNGDWTTPDGVKGIVGKMREAGVPLETVWTDLDYMDRYRDFESCATWNKEKYHDLLDFLHKNKQHYVPIVDAGIAKPDAGDTYEAYDKGKQGDVFVKHEDGSEYVGEVWPGDAVYPDWTAKNTQSWWQDCFDHYKGIAPYDGIWLDMNEPANFHMGLKRPGGDLKDDWNFPPFKITNGYDWFWDKTISPSAKLADGYRHYHEHNIFGHQQNIATHNVLLKQNPNQRPFIITRSNFAGTGRWSGHWLGDNYSTWESMRHSVQGVLQFQLFQIPMVGADACGFSGDCPEELANRWMQYAAFTPFYRNHNATGCADQEPFRWPGVAAATKKALETRYQLLPYWETLFAHASKDGSPPIRTLYFEFNEQEYSGIDEQFLLGPDLLISPALHEGQTEVEAYLPEAGGVWRDWYTHKAVKVDSSNKATLPTPIGSINVHIRPGAIILTHPKPAYNLTDTRTSDYGLIVSLDGTGEAKGVAILDDGLSVKSKSTTVSFTASHSGLKISSQGDYTDAPRLTSVTVLGAGEGDEGKHVDVKALDLSKDGEVKW